MTSTHRRLLRWAFSSDVHACTVAMAHTLVTRHLSSSREKVVACWWIALKAEETDVWHVLDVARVARVPTTIASMREQEMRVLSAFAFRLPWFDAAVTTHAGLLAKVGADAARAWVFATSYIYAPYATAYVTRARALAHVHWMVAIVPKRMTRALGARTRRITMSK